MGIAALEMAFLMVGTFVAVKVLETVGALVVVGALDLAFVALREAAS